MQRKRPGQPVGGDIDWFVIPIERIRQWALIALVVLIAAGLGYYLFFWARRSPEGKAGTQICGEGALFFRISTTASSPRPGSNAAQAKDLLSGAQDAFGNKKYDEAFRLAVESESFSRRAMGSSGSEEAGDASFIFVEGDVSLQTAGRST